MWPYCKVKHGHPLYTVILILYLVNKLQRRGAKFYYLMVRSAFEQRVPFVQYRWTVKILIFDSFIRYFTFSLLYLLHFYAYRIQNFHTSRAYISPKYIDFKIKIFAGNLPEQNIYF